MTLEVKVLQRGDLEKRFMLKHDAAISNEGTYAMEVARSLAVAPKPLFVIDENGHARAIETTRGHQTVRLFTVEEVVQRASDIAASMFAECAKRGWSTPLPKMSELVEASSPVGFTAPPWAKALDDT